MFNRTEQNFIFSLYRRDAVSPSIFWNALVHSGWALWAHRRQEQQPADCWRGSAANLEPQQPCWEGSLSVYQIDSKAAKGAAEASFAKDRHNAEKYVIAASDWIYLWFNCWTVSLVI